MYDHAGSAIRIGQSIGPYRIEGLLGTGGMGRVYLARDCQLRRTVAIKFVDQSKKDPQSLRALLREARLAAALNHPSICSVHEVGRLGDEPFIVMEHVKGLSLSTVLQRMGALPIGTAIRYEMQIVSGVAHAHEQQIVHGDLKASNVMIEPQGRVKILDFGLAIQGSLARTDDVVETTAIAPSTSHAGTVPYMAPELLRGHEANVQSDIWAMGVVLFEMLAGFRPFRGATTYELAAHILSNEPVAFSPLIPPSIRRVIDRSLLTNPLERYDSASEFGAALDDMRWQWQSFGSLRA
jgi:serine/threonine protein kinase